MVFCAKRSSRVDEASRPLKILIFIGSTREGRMVERVAMLVQRSLAASGHLVYVVDPEEVDVPLLRNPVHFYPNQSDVPKVLSDLNKRIIEADAIVIVTAEYNRSLPPALINLMDHFPPNSFSSKPSAIVSYTMGFTGGSMAAATARVFLVELGALPVPAMVNISEVHNAIDKDGETRDESILSGLRILIAQLDWWAIAARHQREVAGEITPLYDLWQVRLGMFLYNSYVKLMRSCKCC